jgi:hypothetical protein
MSRRSWAPATWPEPEARLPWRWWFRGHLYKASAARRRWRRCSAFGLPWSPLVRTAAGWCRANWRDACVGRARA